MDDKDNTTSVPQTNTERLRTHLPTTGLAAALLSAWEETEPADVHKRLMAALIDFYLPEKASDAKAKAK